MYNTEWTDYNEGYSTQHTLNRYNLRSNIDIDVNKFLNVSLDLGGRIDNISQPGIDTWNIFTWGAGENLPINLFLHLTVIGSFLLIATVRMARLRLREEVLRRIVVVTYIQH